MVNSWSLAWEVLNGTMDENYPIIDTKSGAGNTAYEYSIDGLDYETDYYTESDIDDMYIIIIQMLIHHTMMGGHKNIIKNN